MLGGKLGLILQVLFYALIGRARRFDIVLTEPSLLSLTGHICKVFGAKRWVVDVWDVPGRGGGQRGQLAQCVAAPEPLYSQAGFYVRGFFPCCQSGPITNSDISPYRPFECW